MSGLYRELGEKKQELLRMLQSVKTTAVAAAILEDEAERENDHNKNPRLHPALLDNHPLVCAVGKVMRELIIVTIGQGMQTEKGERSEDSDVRLSRQFVDDFRDLASVSDERGELSLLGETIRLILSQTILDVRVCLSVREEELNPQSPPTTP